ncbi:MAG: hypothetical protein IKF78_11605 [Atopobiaceae bacterium]|nr:hypothetical protein [Atopobiaceae bacterium]
MIDGIYEVKARTPLGKKGGTVVLITNGSVCDADLFIGKKSKHLQGTLDGEQVTFEGSVKMPSPFGKVKYRLTGTVEGDALIGLLRTKKFKFKVRGNRVS